jgi:hypothetical protein
VSRTDVHMVGTSILPLGPEDFADANRIASFFLAVFLAQTLKNGQSATPAAILLPLLQKGIELFTLRAQALQDLPVFHPLPFQSLMYELAPLPIGTEAFLDELEAGSGLILGGSGIAGADLLVSVGEVALSRVISTFSLKGHTMPLSQYLQV